MGYEQKQVLGAQVENLVAPARRQAFKDAFTAILAGHQVDNLDLQILRGDGRVGQFSVNLSPMRDEHGQRHQHRGGDERHHRCGHITGQADARGENGGGRAIGLWRRPRGE